MTNKRKRHKMHVKKGDLVKIISGHDKGKTGYIMETFKDIQKVLIKDINMKTKHSRPTQEGQTGQIIRIEAPIASSNVMLYDETKQVASRFRKIKNSDGQYKRVLIKLENNN